jgi:hypothetical protein
MSQWEYEAGRKTCIENMARGDFSNHLCGIDPKTSAEKKRLREWAKRELKRLMREKKGNAF